MKAQKRTIESEVIQENNNGHIYLSVTPYDEYQDTVEYVVNRSNGETIGRYDNAEEAYSVYNSEAN